MEKKKKNVFELRYLNHSWTEKGKATNYPTNTVIEKQFSYEGEIILRLPQVPTVEKKKNK